jgi:hypothetical protein
MCNKLLFQSWIWSHKNWTIYTSRSAAMKVAGFGCPWLYESRRHPPGGLTDKATDTCGCQAFAGTGSGIQSPPKDLPYLEGTALRHNWVPMVISQFATHFLRLKTIWDSRISVFKSHPAWMKMKSPHSVLGRPNFCAPSSLGRWSVRMAEVWSFCLNVVLPLSLTYAHC